MRKTENRNTKIHSIQRKQHIPYRIEFKVMLQPNDVYKVYSLRFLEEPLAFYVGTAIKVFHVNNIYLPSV